MLEFETEALVRVVAMLSHARQYALDHKGVNRPMEDVDGAMADELTALADHLSACGMHISAHCLEEIVGVYFRRASVAEMPRLVDHFTQTLIKELLTKRVFALSVENQAFMAEPELAFGSETIARFPMIRADVEEASRCLAFDRGTAAVFHLLRVSEHGMRALGGKLGIPYAPSWEGWIRQIRTLVEKPHAAKSRAEKRDQAFYEEMIGDLHAIKTAWRNPTMHVRRAYSPAEAREVFGATRTWMAHVATRCRGRRLSTRRT